MDVFSLFLVVRLVFDQFDSRYYYEKGSLNETSFFTDFFFTNLHESKAICNKLTLNFHGRFVYNNCVIFLFQVTLLFIKASICLILIVLPLITLTLAHIIVGPRLVLKNLSRSHLSFSQRLLSSKDSSFSVLPPFYWLHNSFDVS